MIYFKKNYQHVLQVFVFSLFFLYVFSAAAGVAIQTELVSGKIISVSEGIIVLYAYGDFHPANPDSKTDFKRGSEVTIRYVKGADGIKRYIEVAKGVNTLTLEKVSEKTPKPSGFK